MFKRKRIPNQLKKISLKKKSKRSLQLPKNRKKRLRLMSNSRHLLVDSLWSISKTTDFSE